MSKTTKMIKKIKNCYDDMKKRHFDVKCKTIDALEPREMNIKGGEDMTNPKTKIIHWCGLHGMCNRINKNR